MRKKLLLLSSIVFLGGVFTPLFAQRIETEEGFRVNLYIDLDNAIQQIPKIVFAVPNPDGSWKDAGQVEVTQDVHTLMVGGSLITNYEQRNRMAGEVRNSSILGGSGNTIIGDATESTIIGGEKNRITTSMSLIAGGKENTISTGDRSTILGGQGNTVSGSVNTVIGGKNTDIKGSNDTIIGTNNHISGNNSLAVGSGATINANASFAWNDGSTPLTVTQSNVFVVKGQRGLVVSKDTPHPSAALSVGGTLRVQVNDAKNAELGVGITCRTELAGTVKSVKAVYNAGEPNAQQICACLCNGKNRTPMITTPQCTNACEGRAPQDITKDKPVCGTVFGTCARGVLVKDTFSYVYGTLSSPVKVYQGPTANGLNYPQSGKANTGVANIWYWTCRNPETNISVECSTRFYCTSVTPIDSAICRYSTTNNNQKDDRELKQNVAKVLVGQTSNRCRSATDTSPKKKEEVDGQINNCTESSAHSDADQTKKCQFFCPNGRHPESDGNCYQNSYKYEPLVSSGVTGGLSVTYKPDCLLAGHSDTEVETIRSADGHGTRTFTATFTNPTGEQAGTRIMNETINLTCDTYWYRWTEGTSDPKDDRCIPTHREPTGSWYGCTAPTPQWYGCNASPVWGDWGACNDAGKKTRSCSTGYGNRTSCSNTSGTEYKDGQCWADDSAGRRTSVSNSYCSGSSSKLYNQGCSRSCGSAPSCSATCSQSSETVACNEDPGTPGGGGGGGGGSCSSPDDWVLSSPCGRTTETQKYSQLWYSASRGSVVMTKCESSYDACSASRVKPSGSCESVSCDGSSCSSPDDWVLSSSCGRTTETQKYSQIWYSASRGSAVTTKCESSYDACSASRVKPSGSCESVSCDGGTSTSCTSDYSLTSCPSNGSCSSCGGKYKLDSCESGYTKSSNSCVDNRSCKGSYESGGKCAKYGYYVQYQGSCTRYSSANAWGDKADYGAVWTECDVWKSPCTNDNPYGNYTKSSCESADSAAWCAETATCTSFTTQSACTAKTGCEWK